MARVNVNLQPNEGIVLQNDDVARKLSRGQENGNLILTNKNLYFTKGRGKKAEITILPLNQVKIVNGQPQVTIGGYKAKPSLQIFMINSQEEFLFTDFSFPANAKKELEKWVNSIQQLVCELVPPQSVVSPQTIILQQPTVEGTKNTDNNGSDPIPEESSNSKVSCKCIGCMAPILGNKGETVRCKYCDTEQIL